MCVCVCVCARARVVVVVVVGGGVYKCGYICMGGWVYMLVGVYGWVSFRGNEYAWAVRCFLITGILFYFIFLSGANWGVYNSYQPKNGSTFLR